MPYQFILACFGKPHQSLKVTIGNFKEYFRRLNSRKKIPKRLHNLQDRYNESVLLFDIIPLSLVTAQITGWLFLSICSDGFSRLDGLLKEIGILCFPTTIE